MNSVLREDAGRGGAIVAAGCGEFATGVTASYAFHTVFFTVTAIIVSAVQILVGVALGVWLRRDRAGGPAAPLSQERQAMGGLRTAAHDLVHDVAQHTARVEQAGRALAALPDDAQAIGPATELLKANHQLQEELASAQVQLELQAIQIEERLADVRFDVLTGLPNRLPFDDELARRLNDAVRRKKPLSLLMFDVDWLEELNSRHSREAGDRVLKEIAGALCECARGFDLVVRFADDQFAVTLPGADVEQSQHVAERMRTAVETRIIKFGEQELRSTVSVGAATLRSGERGDELVSRAERALRASKLGDRNCGHYHDGETWQVIPPRDLTEDRSVREGDETESAVPAAAGDAADGANRRGAARRSFDFRQFVAPYNGGSLPNKATFREVACQDISATGFSFYSSQLPDFDSLVVALGVAPNLTYMTARIVNRAQVADDPAPMYRIGCRFSGRVQ